MKGIIRKIAIAFMLAAICVTAEGQLQLQTKKFRLAQFANSTTKVVLTGNEMNDALYREGVKKIWNISPYEFCDMRTFEAEKNDSTKFFLLVSESTALDEEGAGIYTLGIFQGSKKKNLYKVSSIPFCSTDKSDGREFIFLPLLLRALQEDVKAIMRNEINIGNMVKVRSGKKHWDKKVCFGQDDLAVSLGASSIAAYKEFGMFFVTEEEIETKIKNADKDALVAYSISPAKDSKIGYSYKMILDAASGELYYFNRHLPSDSKKGGFLKSDLNSIMSHKK